MTEQVAIIRAGEWDCTQAIPRVLETIEQIGLRATVLCWDMTGKAAPEQMQGVHRILRFRRYVPPHSVKLFLNWPRWWRWVGANLATQPWRVIHAMNADSLPPATKIARRQGCPVIYDVRDPFGLVLANVRWPVPHVFARMERYLAAKADGIVLSQGDLERCGQYFGPGVTDHVPAVRMLNVPTCELPETWRPPAGRPMRINVSGYISPVRGAWLAIELARRCRDIHLDVVGELRYGDLEEAFKSLPNATVYGRVPHARAMELMDQADLIWLHYDNSLANVAIASANKMFEAMMLGKPYLTADGSWMAQVAAERNLGWSVAYGDIPAMADLIDRLVRESALRVEAGQRGREAFSSFAWKTQQENLLRLYRRLLGEPEQVRQVLQWRRFLGDV